MLGSQSLCFLGFFYDVFSIIFPCFIYFLCNIWRPDSPEMLAVRLWEEVDSQLSKLQKGEEIEVMVETFSFLWRYEDPKLIQDDPKLIQVCKVWSKFARFEDENNLIFWWFEMSEMSLEVADNTLTMLGEGQPNLYLCHNFWCKKFEVEGRSGYQCNQCMSDAAKLGKQLGSILNFPCEIIAFRSRLALPRFYWRAARCGAFGKSRIFRCRPPIATCEKW